MKLFESVESKITKDENVENVPHLEITEVVLVFCNIVNNDYQQSSRILYTFATNESFGLLLDISPNNLTSLHFKKVLTPSFYTLKYGLLMKTLNCWR